MWRILKKRVTAGAMAAMLMLVNVVMPVQPVFADPGNGNGGGGSGGTTGTMQPVWCQYTNEWTAQIGDTGNDNNKNRFPLTELPAGASNELNIQTNSDTGLDQVYAPDSSDSTLKGALDAYCEQQYTVEIPATPAIDDPCGDGNATWIVPANDEILNWNVNMSGHLIVTIVAAGYVFTDGTHSHDYGVAVDSGEACPATKVTIPLALEGVDPCGLDNASLITDVLKLIDGLTFEVNPDGSVTVTAKDGFVLTIDGETTFATHVYDAYKDAGKLCEVESEAPTFVDNCGVADDYYIVKDTEKVEYYNGEELLVAGQKYYVTDASEVTVTAKVTNVNYEIVNDEYTNQFTDEACDAAVSLKTKAWCTDVVDTTVKAVLTNETESWQAYEVVVSNDEGELVSRVVVVPAGETKNLKNTFEGDGEFTISVYSYNNETRGELLDEQTVMTECVDTFTPEIYKKNQDGAILSTGTFDVEVCQEYGEFARLFMDNEGDNCTTYEDVMFGTDGSWFANNVEYEHNVPTTVTITETEAPVGCELSITPWVFTWNYLNMDVNAFNAFLAQREGSWEMTSGVGSVDGQVFNLTNNCDQPGRGEYTPTPSTPSTPVETLAETGDSENAIIGVAAGMLLASIGLAISPRFRRGEA